MIKASANITDNTIESVPNLLKKLTELGKEHKCWYRGESKDHGKTKLLPAIFREHYEDEEFLHNEEGMINEFFAEFPQSAGDDYLSYMQHYGFPTRLLDWSVSPLIALFFACESQSAHDGKLYCLKYVELNKQSDEQVKRELFSDHDLIDARIKLARNKEQKTATKHRRPVAVKFPMSNERIKSQLGRFTMHGGLQNGSSKSSPLHFATDDKLKETIEELTIPAKMKQNIMEELKTLGFDAHVVYRDDPARLKQTLLQQSALSRKRARETMN